MLSSGRLQGTPFALLPRRTSELKSLEYLRGPAPGRPAFLRSIGHLAIVVALTCLGAANVYQRATWTEHEDGVFWELTANQVTAKIVAEDSPAARAGVRVGDIISEIDGQRIERVEDVTDRLHAARP